MNVDFKNENFTNLMSLWFDEGSFIENPDEAEINDDGLQLTNY